MEKQTNKQHIIKTNKTGPEINKSMQETHMKHVRKHEQTNISLNTQEKTDETVPESQNCKKRM